MKEGNGRVGFGTNSAPVRKKVIVTDDFVTVEHTSAFVSKLIKCKNNVKDCAEAL